MLNEKRKTLAIACLVIFVDMIGYGIIIPILPIYSQNLGASEAQIGFLFASYAIVLLLTLLPFGMVVDRYGKKPLIVLGMFLLFVSSILYASSQSLLHLMLSRMLQGLSASCTWAAALPLAAYAATEAKRGLEMSAVTIATGLGAVLGPIIGGLGAIQFPFYLLALFSLALCLFSLLYLREARAEREFLYLREKLARIFRLSGVQVACIGVIFVYFALGMLEVLFPLYMAGCGYQRVNIGLLFGIYAFFFIGIQPLVGAWSDNVGRISPIVLGLFLGALFLPIPFFFTTIIPWILVLSILGLAAGAVYTPTLPLIADSVDLRDQGVAYALYTSMHSVGYLLGPWLGGILAEKAGIRMPFYLSSAILILGAFGIIYISNKKAG